MSRYVVSLFLVLLMIWGCDRMSGNDKRLPSDIVHNPESASGNDEKGSAAIEFEEMSHDFGKIIQGEKVTYAFKFKNTGNAQLIISDVSTSCGCTVPKYTKKPLKPGETGVLNVTFDSENRRGFQHKTVTVVSNTVPNTTILKIKAQVIVPK